MKTIMLLLLMSSFAHAEKDFVDRLIDEQEKDIKKLRELKKKIESNVQKNSESLEADLKRIGNNLKNNFNDLTNRLRGNIIPEAPFPKIDVLDEKTSYQILAEVPGVGKKDMVVLLDKQIITISGKRLNQVSKTEESFKKSVHLRDLVDPKSLKTELTDGILTIQIKKL